MITGAHAALVMLVVAGAAVVAPFTAGAQTPDAVSTPPGAPAESGTRLCFRGRPAPRCTAFFLYELGYFQRIAGTMFDEGYPPNEYRRPELESHVSLELGAMVNRGDRRAIGGTVLLAGARGVGGSRLAFKGRYRQWLEDGRGTVDLSAGVLRADVPRVYPQHGRVAYGLTGDVSLGYGDLAALTLRADAVQAGGHASTSVYAGAKLGSYPAVGASVVIVALTALVIAALSQAGF